MIHGAAVPDSPEVIALVGEGMRLVEPIVRQLRALFAMRGESEDQIALGHEGVLIAARTFDRARGIPFDRWCTLKVRSAILDGLRREAEMPRRFHRQLRAMLAASEAEEGLLDEHASSPPPSTPEAADEQLTTYLTAIATSMALGTLMIHDDEVLEGIEDDRGTVEDHAMHEELKERVRAAIAERPQQERAMLEAVYFEGKTHEQASGGLSRSWSSRLLARATKGVALSLKRSNFER